MKRVRKGVRVVEGARLERVYGRNLIVGSNPTLSASVGWLLFNGGFFDVGVYFIFWAPTPPLNQFVSGHPIYFIWPTPALRGKPLKNPQRFQGQGQRPLFGILRAKPLVWGVGTEGPHI